MSLNELKASLELWRSRQQYRQRKLDYYHLINDGAGIKKWEALNREAVGMVHMREGQIAKLIIGDPRHRIVAVAKQAKVNYQKQPGAYHYLAGGIPNNIIMAPSPRSYRSDCSQFVASVYKIAKVPCPGSGTYLYTNTQSMVGTGHRVSKPNLADLRIYCYGGDIRYTHHVELVTNLEPLTFIGHGTPAIDSLVPGGQYVYWTYPFLNN